MVSFGFKMASLSILVLANPLNIWDLVGQIGCLNKEDPQQRVSKDRAHCGDMDDKKRMRMRSREGLGST